MTEQIPTNLDRIKRLLDKPEVCGAISNAFPVVEACGVALTYEMPKFTQGKDIDASAVVLAMGELLNVLRMFDDKHKLNTSTREKTTIEQSDK